VCFKAGSFVSSSAKSAAWVMKSKAWSNIGGSGEYDSRCSRLYIKSANGLLKSAVGGPKRWEGLPYRGPAGQIVASLTAEALLTLSDGEGASSMAFDNSSRAARHEYTPKKTNEQNTYPSYTLNHLKRHLPSCQRLRNNWLGKKTGLCVGTYHLMK